MVSLRVEFLSVEYYTRGIGSCNGPCMENNWRCQSSCIKSKWYWYMVLANLEISNWYLVPGTRAVLQCRLVLVLFLDNYFILKLVLVHVWIIFVFSKWHWYLFWIIFALSNWYWCLFFNNYHILKLVLVPILNNFRILKLVLVTVLKNIWILQLVLVQFTF